MSDEYKVLGSTSAEEDPAPLGHVTEGISYPLRVITSAAYVVFGATITPDAGNGFIAGDCDNTDYSGHEHAVGRSLHIPENSLVIFTYRGEAFLYVGDRGITVGLDGSNTTVDANFVEVGSADHAALINLNMADAHPITSITGLRTELDDDALDLVNHIISANAHPQYIESPETHANLIGTAAIDSHPIGAVTGLQAAIDAGQQAVVDHTAALDPHPQYLQGTIAHVDTTGRLNANAHGMDAITGLNASQALQNTDINNLESSDAAQDIVIGGHTTAINTVTQGLNAHEVDPNVHALNATVGLVAALGATDTRLDTLEAEQITQDAALATHEADLNAHGGGGAGGDHTALINRGAVDSHPIAAVTGLDGALATLTQDAIDHIDDQVISDPHDMYIPKTAAPFIVGAGYGNVITLAATAPFALGITWVNVDFPGVGLPSPLFVQQDTTSGGLMPEIEGVWTLLMALNFSFDGSNSPRSFGIRLQNDTDGTSVKSTIFGVGRNQDTLNATLPVMFHLTATDINKLYTVQIGGNDGFSNTIVQQGSFGISHVGPYII